MNKWIELFREEQWAMLDVFNVLAEEMKEDNWIESGSGFTAEEIELIKVVGDQIHVHLTYSNCIRYPISDFMNPQGVTFNLSEVLVMINYLRLLKSQRTKGKQYAEHIN